MGDKMKNKILLSLLLLLTLLIITGCKNNLISKETKNEKSEFDIKGDKYSCVNNDYINTSDLKTSVKETSVLQNNILKMIIIESNFNYSDKAKYKESCDSTKKNGEDVNNQKLGYVSYEVRCNNSKNEVTIKKYYVVEKALENKNVKEMLSTSINYIKDDGSYDLVGWKKEMTKRSYTCEW